MPLLVLSDADVRQLLSYPDCVTVVRAALASLAEGRAGQPLRSLARLAGAPGLLGLMPAYLAAGPELAPRPSPRLGLSRGVRDRGQQGRPARRRLAGLSRGARRRLAGLSVPFCPAYSREWRGCWRVFHDPVASAAPGPSNSPS